MITENNVDYEAGWKQEIKNITVKAAETSWPLTTFCCFFFIFVEVSHRDDPNYFRRFVLLDFGAGIILLLMHLLRKSIRYPMPVITYGSSVLVTIVATIAAVMAHPENVFTYFWIVSMITVVRGLLYCQKVAVVAGMALVSHLTIVLCTIFFRDDSYADLPNILSTNIIQLFMVMFSLSGANIRYKLTRQNFYNNYTIRSASQMLEDKNRDITDSIGYARRIQHSLLASRNLLNKHLPEHFIFFQPKDIVSGDFYWASPLDNDTFALVVGDSTGHGVPGAIMSMLNISCLGEAVNAKSLTTADDILNHTRSRIMEHMANDGSEEGGKDGMDAVLACFDFNKYQLTFSAANNPLWLVRGGKLLEFPPDKMPVGKPMGKIRPFSKHTVPLEKGDLVVMFTDGFPDQFGGPKGKKLMYRRLKELIVKMSHVHCSQAGEELRQAFENWKGNYEQVDDVLVFGVRV